MKRIITITLICGFYSLTFSQNFGIDQPNPQSKLHVTAGDASYALFGPNSSWNSYLYVGAGTNTISSGRAQVISTNGNLHLDAGVGQNIYIANYNGSNTFMQTGGGNVGIGTTGPSQKLDVAGNITAHVYYDRDNIGYYINPNGYSNFNQLNISRDGAGECCSGGNYTLSLAESTSGTGRTATIEFHNGGASEGYIRLANGGQRRMQFADNQGALMGIEATGYITAQNFYATSDARLKDNVRPITDALGIINSVRGVRYNWKKETQQFKGGMTGPEIGVLAQEVEKVLPEAVSEIGSDGFKAVAYDKFVPILIEAVKEQQQIIEKLEQRIQVLESK